MALKSLNATFENRANRASAMEQGFYDGRFKNKVVQDKKKEQNKRAAKNFRYTPGNYN